MYDKINRQGQFRRPLGFSARYSAFFLSCPDLAILKF